MNSSDYQVSKIDKRLARTLIKTHHYSKAWSSSKYTIGLLKNDFVVGVACYGSPVGRMVSDSISPLIKQNEILELKRLWIADSEGKNVESWFLGQTFKWLKLNDKTIKVLVSYSDPDHGHLGIIYQATNWLYQGDQMNTSKSFFYKIKGNLLHPRTVFNKYGTNEESELRKIDPELQLVQTMYKHRYLYILAQKRERKRIVDSLKHPILPYPKSLDHSKMVGVNSLIQNEKSKKFFE